MEPNQIKQIAKDAQVNHWPSHLGLNTDAERIYWLAQQLETQSELVDEMTERCETCSTCPTHGNYE